MNKSGWLLIIVAVILLMAINTAQWKKTEQKMSQIEIKMDRMTRGDPYSADAVLTGVPDKKGYEITMDMWQVFEKEAQEYRQRVREANSQFDEQKKAWEKILADLKKTLQEYDKFMSAEGEFWEKQLKNYDNLLAGTEQRLQVLDGFIGELKYILDSAGSLREYPDARTDADSLGAGQSSTERALETRQPQSQKIVPEIRGRGEYKTYPLASDYEEKERDSETDQGPEIIRGTIKGRGNYKTY